MVTKCFWGKNWCLLPALIQLGVVFGHSALLSPSDFSSALQSVHLISYSLWTLCFQSSCDFQQMTLLLLRRWNQLSNFLILNWSLIFPAFVTIHFTSPMLQGKRWPLHKDEFLHVWARSIFSHILRDPTLMILPFLPWTFNNNKMIILLVSSDYKEISPLLLP